MRDDGKRPAQDGRLEGGTATRLLQRVAGSFRRFGFRARMLVIRRFSSSLTRRIAILNLAGLAALFLGFLWVNQTRVGVIDARAQSLSLQAEIIAAAIAQATSAESIPLELDPEKLLQQQLLEPQQREDARESWFEFSINPALAAPVLRRLVTPTRTRARVFDREGVLLLDTRAFYRPGDFAEPRVPAVSADDGQTLFARSWSAVKQRFGRVDLSSSEDTPGLRQFQEVQRAIKGAQSTVVRVSTDGQTVVFAASPVQRGGVVRGALLLSTQEGDVDRIIATERRDLLMVFLIAAAVMLVLSAALAGAIAEPVRKLSEAADRVRRGTRARQEIPDFSDRADEIGQLSVSLRDMTGALYSRIEAIERFAADVSHELKNPLTSLRSAVETLPLARTPESRARLIEVIVHDVKRLDRLITDISDASRLDAEMQRSELHPVDLSALLQTIIGMRRDVAKPGDPTLLLSIDEEAARRGRLAVRAHDSRLVQVIDNLIENAESFSPEGGSVRVSARRVGPQVEIAVEDDGPGVPEHARAKIFDRFYTDRPDHGFGQHSGLGLSISKQIIEAHGGTIEAGQALHDDGSPGGARFTIRMPAVTRPE